MGGRAPGAPPLDPPMINAINLYVEQQFDYPDDQPRG